jgi:hypothetical protein
MPDPIETVEEPAPAEDDPILSDTHDAPTARPASSHSDTSTRRPESPHSSTTSTKVAASNARESGEDTAAKPKKAAASGPSGLAAALVDANDANSAAAASGDEEDDIVVPVPKPRPSQKAAPAASQPKRRGRPPLSQAEKDKRAEMKLAAKATTKAQKAAEKKGKGKTAAPEPTPELQESLPRSASPNGSSASQAQSLAQWATLDSEPSVADMTMVDQLVESSPATGRPPWNRAATDADADPKARNLLIRRKLAASGAGVQHTPLFLPSASQDLSQAYSQFRLRPDGPLAQGVEDGDGSPRPRGAAPTKRPFQIVPALRQLSQLDATQFSSPLAPPPASQLRKSSQLPREDDDNDDDDDGGSGASESDSDSGSDHKKKVSSVIPKNRRAGVLAPKPKRKMSLANFKY